MFLKWVKISHTILTKSCRNRNSISSGKTEDVLDIFNLDSHETRNRDLLIICTENLCRFFFYEKYTFLAIPWKFLRPIFCYLWITFGHNSAFTFTPCNKIQSLDVQEMDTLTTMWPQKIEALNLSRPTLRKYTSIVDLHVFFSWMPTIFDQGF